MSAEYRGSLTLGAAFPGALTTGAKLNGAVNASLPELQAKLQGAVLAQARLTATPPSLTGNLEIARAIVAGVQAAIEVGAPGVDLQLSILEKLIASIQLQISDLEASASFAGSLTALFGTGGVHVFTAVGNANRSGTDLQSAIDAVEISGSSGGIFLVATSAAGRAAIGTFCGVELTS